MKNTLLFTAKYEDFTNPPPYKHSFIIEVGLLPDGIQVDYKLTYLERDAIDEEEILAEGFTLNDDFQWNGKLKLLWKELLVDFVKKNEFVPSKDSELELLFPDSEIPKVPEKLEELHYLMQELTQAIFEVAGKEAPLEITFLDISNDEKTETSTVISFAERSISFLKNVKGQVKKIKKDWKESKKLMELVYSLDYLPEQATTNLPKKDGKYIDIGEGVWYEFGKSAINPGKKKDFIALLQKEINI